MNVIQKSLRQGINLRGTRHAGKSAAELRGDDPKLALRWVSCDLLPSEIPGSHRWKERSRTLPGIAKAMAEQWGAR